MIDEPTVNSPAAKGGAPVHPTMSMLDVTKRYNAIAALTDVSFEVLPGEVHALLGENGAGKSTLMNVASGTTAPDVGTIIFDGSPVENLTPAMAQDLGIAIVHQHPALLPDMTVAENIRVAVGLEHLRRRNPDVKKAMRSLLDDVHFLGHLEDRVSSLSVARRHLLELAKAFALSPRLLILDEPTAPLSQDSVELLFAFVRKLAAGGTAVVYITHRLAEVREIADRVTVLRDGKLRGTSAVSEISDADLLAMIIGRTLATTFPPKHVQVAGEAPILRVEGLSGHGFQEVSFTAGKGEIVGIAGVAGNGQPALLRALSGRERSTGSVNVGGRELSRRALLECAAYMPADRLTEGLMVELNVRENTAMTALDRLRVGPIVSRRREVEIVERELSELDVRAPSLEAPVSSLSGGNQQKVMMARAMLSEPAILVADEPTQGVDVGARAEIYRILREVSARGVPVVVVSSDALELEGLCDRVIVMSRGQAVTTLHGDAVTEERIVHAAISATAHSAERAARPQRGVSRLARFIEGDYAPVAILALVIVALGAYVLHHNDRYLQDFNINSVMFACAALGFISLGQTFALLLGGIDLSVGPLAGFLVVLGLLHPRRQVTRGLGARVRPHARGRRRSRPPERRAHPLREVHAGRCDARHLHRPGRLGVHAALCAGRLHRHLGDRRHLEEGRTGSTCLRGVRRVRPGPRARAPKNAVRHAPARSRVGRGGRAPCRGARQQDSADRLPGCLAPDPPGRDRAARAARRR